jgi:hypothetical protein
MRGWSAFAGKMLETTRTPMTIRIAAIEVSHRHAVYDAAHLRHLIAMPDVELVAIQNSDAGVAVCCGLLMVPAVT